MINSEILNRIIHHFINTMLLIFCGFKNNFISFQKMWSRVLLNDLKILTNEKLAIETFT